MTNPPIVICSTEGKCLPVLAASIEQYVPEGVDIYWAAANPTRIRDTRHRWHILPNTASNFGDAYNAAIQAALDDGHSSVIIANDDVVLTPDSYSLLMEDVNELPQRGHRSGLVGARCDRINFAYQNIRTKLDDSDVLTGGKWGCESMMIKINSLAPVFAWVDGDAFRQCPFPPITAGSDDVQCWDMAQLGYEVFISRSYVHHVGGVTLHSGMSAAGSDHKWIRENRPILAAAVGM
jgi:hypothetical protein